MQNKYSKKSDYKINELILKKLGIEIYNGYQDEPSIKAYAIEGKTRFLCDFDFCNDNNDAFQLMIDKKISLRPNYSIRNKEPNDWLARDLKSSHGFMATNVKPCRAIAECFLLMTDAENE